MTGDLDWLDKALAKARRRAYAVDGIVPPPQPTPQPPAPGPEPAPEPRRGPLIPPGPRGEPPPGDLIRAALRRHHR